MPSQPPALFYDSFLAWIAIFVSLAALVDFLLGKSGNRTLQSKLTSWWLHLSYMRGTAVVLEEAKFTLRVFQFLFGQRFSGQFIGRCFLFVFLCGAGSFAIFSLHAHLSSTSNLLSFEAMVRKYDSVGYAVFALLFLFIATAISVWGSIATLELILQSGMTDLAKTCALVVLLALIIAVSHITILFAPFGWLGLFSLFLLLDLQDAALQQKALGSGSPDIPKGLQVLVVNGEDHFQYPIIVGLPIRQAFLEPVHAISDALDYGLKAVSTDGNLIPFWSVLVAVIFVGVRVGLFGLFVATWSVISLLWSVLELPLRRLAEADKGALTIFAGMIGGSAKIMQEVLKHWAT